MTIDSKNADYLILNPNKIYKGNFLEDGKLKNFDDRQLVSPPKDLRHASYLVPFRALDFHCHGINKYDFSEVKDLELEHLERILQQQNINCILTICLRQSYFNDFLLLMDSFLSGKLKGKYPHILGMALEGPILSSHGGTPGDCVWYPSKEEWEKIANCGKKGLCYVILSPDAYLTNQMKLADLLWITDTLIEGNVLPAIGHFLKSHPEESAAAVTKMLERVAKKGKGPTVSDHLFNDMPKHFKHAWRTPAQREKREKELKDIDLQSWNKTNFREKLGPVPAALMQGALDGLIKLCLNFDGEHVDLEVCKKAVEILGASNLIAMTDRVENRLFGRQKLKMYDYSTLLYQEEGIVAAGSNTIANEMDHMRAIGLSEIEIWQLFAFTPYQVLKIPPLLNEEGMPLEFTIVNAPQPIYSDH